ncbi:MAG: pyridine nucleotide-disulfide oxidoreductase [Alphaproteobacteria bacterium]|nr:FAD-dependent oxidoreductase [Alphaproteobacteria bacterium]TAD91526.1 MAG: pyridine nucleotide-disulfide oxidoreductase [Alphaproteobacteria bacterium]
MLALNRRQLLAALAATGTLGAGLSRSRAAPVKTKAHIVIAGAGAGGLAAAAQLSARLDGAKITLVDARREHLYQPGFTLVASGLKPKDYVLSTTAEHVAAGVNWVQEQVAAFDPESNSLTTERGTRITYDYLIVATGLHLDYASIEGMDISLIGREGIGSIYASPDAAITTRRLQAEFVEKGGDGLFGRPATEMKCAGAPLKYTFITDDLMRRAGTRGKAKLTFTAQNRGLFSVPIVSEKVRMLFQDRDVSVRYDHVLTAIDPAKRRATFRTPAGMVDLPWTFINVVPPMRAPAAVRNSPLGWRTGPWKADGWMEVEKPTLRHVTYRNVFALGDVAGVPKGKTAASVKWQTPVVVDHLIAALQDKTSSEVYNGYTSCPLITRIGRAMLVEFDYNDNLTPSFPGVVAPLEELWVTWVMKEAALKPTYFAMLHGQA